MFDKWLDIFPICNFVPFVDIHDTALLVKDVRLNNDWNLNSLYTMLSRVLSLMISMFDVLQLEEKFSWVWIRKSCSVDRDRGALFISALWNLWVAHNKLVFDDVTLNWWDILRFIHLSYVDISRVLTLNVVPAKV
ncbi:hypothetical protein RIF29_08879 [Crotalaria pallida]|uniref:Uncharacterized protein n=1 Tax=Crotalaria pallida TaxID=3830 RepID=A0AAN9IJ71_CROPI